MKRILFSIFTITALIFAGCGKKVETTEMSMQEKVDEFKLVTLNTDLSHLSKNEVELVKVFLEIAKIMDDLFWQQAFGDKSIIEAIEDDATREFAMINYGPWERLNNMMPFVDGFDKKPLGAGFYPSDITKEEFEAFEDENKASLYTIVKRDADGNLYTNWYRDEYKEELAKVDALMEKAIGLAEDAGLKKYLEERRKAFQTDDYLASDMAWMDMKDSNLDFIVGPIENYEDRLYGAKAAYEAFILVKDVEWSKDLAKFTQMLPELQRELPCEPQFKQEVPGTESDINVYEVIYYGGDCNAGSKTIAINLPNDERVHLEKGARRLQLKNSMKAKFDEILMPIAEMIMSEDQLENVKFDAFFSNVTFHEVAHGLGIKNTVNGKGPVRTALGDQYSAWEEAKADILGLYMVTSLIEKGEITNITQDDAYATFIAGILRSVRFGAASAHGGANMMCFNYFEDHQAFTRNSDGKYVIDFEKAKEAMESWAALVLKVEGEGDIDFAKEYSEKHGVIRKSLQKELDQINEAGIPRDIRFSQGAEVLGL